MIYSTKTDDFYLESVEKEDDTISFKELRKIFPPTFKTLLYKFFNIYSLYYDCCSEFSQITIIPHSGIGLIPKKYVMML